ncbi:MAG: Alkaline phosphatase synthesis transcriptional regulatory protein PhoP [Syntrophorhabdaceae bacterium PtaU1.Bin034]|nr:MAG: Alkaline phosphatase synthesis transcriptional regulatory protein PhoP [Syntrophorhabdaceae bacterium PtaU1.Bin034]
MYTDLMDRSLRPQTKRERILFVDDDEAIVLVAQTSLERLGYAVTCRTDGKEAERLFAESPHAFDLLITDQAMPGMKGTELIAHVRHLNPEIPVILLAGAPVDELSGGG